MIGWVIAIAWLALHLPFLPESLEDFDSINFGLGLYDYDLGKNQPHPPGYPAYIAAGRLASAAVRLFGVDDPIRADGVALGLVSVIAGAIALVGAWWLFASLAGMPERAKRSSPGRHDPVAGSTDLEVAWWATLLLGAAPLFWLTGLRPMSDMPGLAMVLVAQALFARAIVDRPSVDAPSVDAPAVDAQQGHATAGARRRTGRWLIAGALVTGLSIGFRSQGVWLTVPWLVAALVAHRQRGLVWLVTRPCTAAVIGILVWAVPMIVASGGLTRYVEMLGAQAGGDFAFVDMLWLDPTPRHLVRALRDSFVQPWHASWLGAIVLLLAAAGGLRSLLRRHTAVALLLLGFAPYAAFHLLFQETVTTRYALPLLVPVAFLCASGLAAVPRPGRIGAAALVALALIVSVPAAVAYGGDAHPAFRALRDMLAAQAAARPGAVFAHHALGRTLDVRAAAPLPVRPTPIGFEWMGAVEYWRDGGNRPVWFLAEPARTDLSLLDPESRSDVVQYDWAVAERPEFGGSRPISAAWYRLPRPGWFAGPGWSLSLEAGGVTVASKTGLEYRAIEAWVRARPEPAWMLIGGLDLAGPGSRPSLVQVTLGDTIIDAWRVDPAASASFLRRIALPEGVPGEPGRYATVRVSARAEEDGAPTPPIAIRQFNVQTAPALMFGFDAGWHEEEYDAASRRRWRWTSDTSVLRIVPPRDVEVRLRGESPLNYFDAPPTVRVRAGARLLATFRPTDDFDWRILVPADALEASDGALAIETDRVYLPGEAEGTSDTRRLGLRLFDVALRPVSP